jgi:hypothetical protein
LRILAALGCGLFMAQAAQKAVNLHFAIKSALLSRGVKYHKPPAAQTLLRISSLKPVGNFAGY